MGWYVKVEDSNGRKYNWPPSGHQVDLDDKRPRSQYHLRARDLLRKLFPTQRLLEEVPLPGMKLTIDFFLPIENLVIEVQGEQHTEFIPHFHGTRANFRKAQVNDHRKVEWCNLNNIDIIQLPYTESDDEWEARIHRR
jgi:hypothetical protein